jgi:hypothetical protein
LNTLGSRAPVKATASVMLNGDALASFVTTGFEDQPSATRLHALSKSVRLGTTTVVGLECSLWHSLVLLENFDCSIALRSPSIVVFADVTFEC